jgi:hypothetical protein
VHNGGIGKFQQGENMSIHESMSQQAYDSRPVGADELNRQIDEAIFDADNLMVLFGGFLTESEPVREASKRFGMISNYELVLMALNEKASDIQVARAMRDLRERFMTSSDVAFFEERTRAQLTYEM